MFTPAPIPSNEAGRLQALLRYQLLDSGNQQKFDDITQLVAEIFGAKIVLISLVDSYRQWFKSKVGLDACELDRESSFCGHAILQKDVFYVENTLADERFAGNPLVVGEPHIRTYAGAPIFSPDGYGVGTLCIIFDQITPLSDQQIARLRRFAQVVQNTAESRLNRLILQAEKERQRQLLSIISHELRTPLASLQMMQAEQGLAQLPPLGRVMVDTTNHLGLVLNDLSASIDPDQEDRITATEDSVFSVTERTIRSLKYLLRRAHINLHFEGDAKSQARCLFNTQALRQLVTNLLKNACIHSEATDLWLRISTTQVDENQISYTMCFLDNGKGVPEEHQSKIFDAGFRSNTKAEGSGLGLFICSDLANKLGGDIQYKTSIRGGAEFIIRLNLRKQAADEQTTDSDLTIGTSQRDTSSENWLEDKHALMVEDSSTFRMLNQALLERQGARVDSAEHGLEALDKTEGTRFDLILTDILMPEMNGFEFTIALRAAGYSGPIVGLSAHPDGEEHRQLQELGANAVLTKPLDISKLIEALQAFN